MSVGSFPNALSPRVFEASTSLCVLLSLFSFLHPEKSCVPVSAEQSCLKQHSRKLAGPGDPRPHVT